MRAWNELVISLECEKDLLRMVIDASSVPEAWSNLLKMDNLGSHDAVYARAYRNLDRLAMYEDESSRNDFMRIRGSIKNKRTPRKS